MIFGENCVNLRSYGKETHISGHVGRSGQLGRMPHAARTRLRGAGHDHARVRPPGTVGEDDTEPDFLRSARQLADRLGIEHIVADVRDEFRQSIVRYFVSEYRAGRTPNPCVVCNRDFKFRLLQEWADRLGCTHMATGHYVNCETHAGLRYLLMGDDVRKDQSYFLWRVPQHILARCVFPLGAWKRPT